MNIIDTDAKEFEEAEFQDIKYNGELLSYLTFEDCTFINCKFQQCDFKGSKFLDCTFISCDLNNIKLESSILQNCAFIESKLTGVNWCQCFKIKITLFDRCNLNYSNFLNLDLRKIKIIDCIAYEVDFREANMQEAVITGTDLKGATFFKSNLMAVDFRNSKNYDIDVLNNKVSKAIFSPFEALDLLRSLNIVLK